MHEGVEQRGDELQRLLARLREGLRHVEGARKGGVGGTSAREAPPRRSGQVPACRHDPPARATIASVPDEEASDEGQARFTSPPSSTTRADAALAALLELMSAPDSEVGGQEKRLVHDLIAHHLPAASRAAQRRVVERAACMRTGALELLRAIVALGDGEFLGILAERAHMPDDMLLRLARALDAEGLRRLLRRPLLPQVVAGLLCRRLPDHRLADLLAREDVALGMGDWRRLCLRAFSVPGLGAAMLARADVPNAIAAELFWAVPPQARRLVPARVINEAGGLPLLLRHAPRPLAPEAGAALARAMARPQACAPSALARLLAAHGDLAEETLARILADDGGEPQVVLLRAAGVGISGLREGYEALAAAGVLPPARRAALLDLLAGMGRSQALVLLIYWDWRARCVGPYVDFPALRVDGGRRGGAARARKNGERGT